MLKPGGIVLGGDYMISNTNRGGADETKRARRRQSTKPGKPRRVTAVRSAYQPSEAGPEKRTRAAATFAVAIDALCRPVRIGYGAMTTR